MKRIIRVALAFLLVFGMTSTVATGAPVQDHITAQYDPSIPLPINFQATVVSPNHIICTWIKPAGVDKVIIKVTCIDAWYGQEKSINYVWQANPLPTDSSFDVTIPQGATYTVECCSQIDTRLSDPVTKTVTIVAPTIMTASLDATGTVGKYYILQIMADVPGPRDQGYNPWVPSTSYSALTTDLSKAVIYKVEQQVSGIWQTKRVEMSAWYPSYPSNSDYYFSPPDGAASGGLWRITASLTLAEPFIDAATGEHEVSLTKYITMTGPRATSLSIRTSATSVKIGQSFILSGLCTPTPDLIGKLVHVAVKKPGKIYWSYSSNRVVYAGAGGLASWWYRYTMKYGMARGTYQFRCAFSPNTPYDWSISPTVKVAVR